MRRSPARTLATLRANARAIIGFALAGLLGGLLWGIADKPTYGATATAVLSGTIPVDASALDRYAELAHGDDVARQAAIQLGNDLPGADLLSLVTFRADSDLGAVVVRASADSADLAAAAANGFVAALVEVAGERERRRLRGAEDELRSRLALLDPLSAEADAIDQRITNQVERQALGDPLQPGRAAAPPANPSSDRSALRWSALGLGVGGAVGLLFTLIGEARRRPIRDGDQLASAIGSPTAGLLGSEATLIGVDEAGSIGVDPVALEGYQRIADELGLSRPDGPRTLAVVSAMPLEGRTSVALGLAVAVAVRGGRPLVIEADLRDPRLSAWLRVADEPGLCEYLAAGAGPREVLRTVPLAGAVLEPQPAVVIVPAGRLVGHPAELLSSARFQRLVETVRRVYDVIIFDTPPLLAAADAAAVATVVDASVFCARAGRTGASAAAHGVQFLGGPPPLAGVLWDVRAGGRGSVRMAPRRAAS